MNFSTVPPWRSIVARRSAKYRRIRVRSASGSVVSPSCVDPTRSAKRTVTTFRSASSPDIRRVYDERSVLLALVHLGEHGPVTLDTLAEELQELLLDLHEPLERSRRLR